MARSAGTVMIACLVSVGAAREMVARQLIRSTAPDRATRSQTPLNCQGKRARTNGRSRGELRLFRLRSPVRFDSVAAMMTMPRQALLPADPRGDE